MTNKKIREVIVVEGRNDTAAVKRALDADTIETHGFGIGAAIWQLIEKAAAERGIIIFTDPDHAGNEIRRRIRERFPTAKEAFLSRDDAERNGDIGIENASPQSILRALEAVRCTAATPSAEFTSEDLFAHGLAGGSGASERRKRLGALLGIGYGNAGAFLAKLNGYGVTRKEYDEALREIDDQRD